MFIIIVIIAMDFPIPSSPASPVMRTSIRRRWWIVATQIEISSLITMLDLPMVRSYKILRLGGMYRVTVYFIRSVSRRTAEALVHGSVI